MKYPGGKNGAGVFQQIICQMPPHRMYVLQRTNAASQH